ncbi:MAG: pyruvate kinase, partial [Saprospiraceae bacterium]
AVLDGADAVMLSGETATGNYPIKVVETMNKIIEIVENDDTYRVRIPKPNIKDSTYHSDVICFSAVEVAKEIKAKAIIGMTVSGYTAFKVSSQRPKRKIYIFSDRMYMLATLNLVWGVEGHYYDRFTTTDDTVNDVVEILKKEGRLESGDFVVNIASMPLHARKRTNMLKITEVE